MPHRLGSLGVLLLGTVGCGPTVQHTIAGFHQPESVLHDAVADEYLVSSVNGHAASRDGNGYISRVLADGAVGQRKFIDGATPGVDLHAPKGMAIVGDVLHVADIDHVRRFHRVTGRPLGAVAIPGARSLNGLTAAPDGSVLVTDTGWTEHTQPTGDDAIWRVAPDGTVARLADGLRLGEPNGIHADHDGVHYVSWRDGHIVQMDHDGREVAKVALPTNQLDGLVRAPDGSWYVSSWRADRVYRVRPNGRVKTVLDRAGVAGMGYDRKRHRLLLPVWEENAVLFVKL